MANLITNRKAGKEKVNLKDPSMNPVLLSNGSMAAMITVLSLAGSDIAESEWEKNLMVWLAEHDQHILGSGMVGFDLDEVAWTIDNFDIRPVRTIIFTNA